MYGNLCTEMSHCHLNVLYPIPIYPAYCELLISSWFICYFVFLKTGKCTYFQTVWDVVGKYNSHTTNNMLKFRNFGLT